MALTDLVVKAAKPKDKSYKLFDGGGLYIEITPNGGKWWRYKYRFDGKESRLSLGTYPDIGLKEARNRHSDERKKLANGVNPSAIRKSEKLDKAAGNSNSFEVIAREWWNSHMKNKAITHKDKVIRRFELYLFPWIGSSPIAEITAPQMLQVVQRVANSNKLETAHRTLQTAGQVFRYAVQTGRAISDITAALKGALPSRSVRHMAAFTEPKNVAALLRAIDSFKGSLTVECALKLAPYVFVRPSELRQAKWADINLDKGEWKFLVSKTKTDHLVPLSIQAVEILRTIHPVSGHGEYVFQGGHSPLKPMSEAAINAALKRMGYDTRKDITGHGFRATARTMLHEVLEFEPHVIEHQLAHKVPDALGEAYNRTRFIERRKVMMQTWADYLDSLKAGIAPLQKD